MASTQSFVATITQGNNGASTNGTTHLNQQNQNNQQIEADRAFLNQVNDLNSPLNSTYHPLFLHK